LDESARARSLVPKAAARACTFRFTDHDARLEGGAINGHAIVLVDAADIPEARAKLAEAGMRTAIY
jgi:hypothetical protein